jgi:hypothetical protein
VTGVVPPEGKGMLDDVERVQAYKRLVLEYEALDEQIDALLAQHHGATESMPDEAYQHYRELASHRDYVYNQMKRLEREIFPDDESP